MKSPPSDPSTADIVYVGGDAAHITAKVGILHISRHAPEPKWHPFEQRQLGGKVARRQTFSAPGTGILAAETDTRKTPSSALKEKPANGGEIPQVSNKMPDSQTHGGGRSRSRTRLKQIPCEQGN